MARTSLSFIQIGEVCDKLPRLGLPNLWVPRRSQFFRIESIAVLGTGKLDLRRVRALTVELCGSPERAL